MTRRSDEALKTGTTVTVTETGIGIETATRIDGVIVTTVLRETGIETVTATATGREIAMRTIGIAETGTGTVTETEIGTETTDGTRDGAVDRGIGVAIEIETATETVTAIGTSRTETAIGRDETPAFLLERTATEIVTGIAIGRRIGIAPGEREVAAGDVAGAAVRNRALRHLRRSINHRLLRKSGVCSGYSRQTLGLGN